MSDKKTERSDSLRLQDMMHSLYCHTKDNIHFKLIVLLHSVFTVRRAHCSLTRLSLSLSEIRLSYAYLLIVKYSLVQKA